MAIQSKDDNVFRFVHLRGPRPLPDDEQELVTSIDFGSPPARNLKTISTELKKHCIAILRGTHDNDLSTAHTEGPDVDGPPAFDIPEAMSDGVTLRFLETAFEWEQLP
jgi:hypothetical protein